MNKMSWKKVFVNSVLLVTLTSGALFCKTYTSPHFQGDWNYRGFITDYRAYKSVNRNWHAGHPYAHALWTANIIEHWFDTNHYWTQGLSEQDRRVAVLAGFMHDVGKAGDTATKFLWKIDHPQDGYNYLLGHKAYQTAQGADFDFSDYFRQLGVSEQDQSIVAMLAGIHYDFGVIVLSGLAQGKSAERLSKLYLKKLEKLCKETKYNNGVVDRRLLMLAMLVSAADIKANTPFSYKPNMLGTLPQAKAAYDGAIVNSYEKFNVEKVGKDARKTILDYFDNEYKPSSYAGVKLIIKSLSHNRRLRKQFLQLRRKLYA